MNTLEYGGVPTLLEPQPVGPDAGEHRDQEERQDQHDDRADQRTRPLRRAGRRDAPAPARGCRRRRFRSRCSLVRPVSSRGCRAPTLGAPGTRSGASSTDSGVVVGAQPQRAVRRRRRGSRPRRCAPPGGRGAPRRTPRRPPGRRAAAGRPSGGSTSRSTTAAQPNTSAGHMICSSTSPADRSTGTSSCSTGVSEPAASARRGPWPRPARARGPAGRRSAPARRAAPAGPSRPRRRASRSRGRRPQRRVDLGVRLLGRRTVAHPAARQVGGRVPGVGPQGRHGAVHGGGLHQLDLVLRHVGVSSACSQLSGGTRKIFAPASAAATIFCWMPPMGPTRPSAVDGSRAGDVGAAGQRPGVSVS